jgi:hypothetical protein
MIALRVCSDYRMKALCVRCGEPVESDCADALGHEECMPRWRCATCGGQVGRQGKPG